MLLEDLASQFHLQTVAHFGYHRLQPPQQPHDILSSLAMLVFEHFHTAFVVKLVLDIAFPEQRPKVGAFFLT